MLKGELNRIEDLLSATRAERDEIGIKYNAVSERVSLNTTGRLSLSLSVCVCVCVA